MSRYIERAESMVRVIGVNAKLQLDLPSGVTPDWRPLIDVIAANEAFEQTHSDYSERQVVRFLISDPDCPSSVRSCLRSARENCRTVREILPREAWQYLTELQLFVDENLKSGLTKMGRHAFLNRITRTCQMIMGLLSSVMTRDLGYQFLRLGRNLERADMITRFIDMRLAVAQPEKLADSAQLSTVQWVNVLDSLSAYQMYRRKVHATVEREQVLWFLLQDDEFPRSFMHCLNAIEESLGALDNSHPCLLAARKAARDIERTSVETLPPEALTEMMDVLQSRLLDIHATLARMYFLPAVGD